MHETFQRLMDAAQKLKNLDKKSEVGRFLGETAQTMSNWTKRGVPREKHVSLAQKLGCRPEFIAAGNEPMVGYSINCEPGEYKLTGSPATGSVDPVRKALDNIASVQPAKAKFLEAQILLAEEELLGVKQESKKETAA